MIFKEIYIDGFGTLPNNFRRSFEKGINIIIGSNEAGKSTLQKFFKFTLFGYPTKIDERMSPISGGTHGGRIKTMLSTGKEVMIERFSGTKGGDVTLTYDNIQSKNSTQLIQWMGHATKSLYDNVYAFTLDELFDLNSLKASGVEDKIFSVGLGLGNMSLSAVESNIQQEINSIYLSKGKVQEIPAIVTQIQLKKNQLQKIQNNFISYQTLQAEAEQLQNNIMPSIESGLKKIREESDRLNDYLKCYDSFIISDNIDKEIETLPQREEYSINGINNFNKLIEKQQEYEDKIKELKYGSPDDKGIADIENEINKIFYNSQLLAHESEVEFLKNNLSNYKQTITDKADDDEKIKRYEKSILGTINKVNSEWVEKNVMEFSNSISHQNKIEGFKKRFKEIENKKVRLEAEEEALKAKESIINIKALVIIIAVIFFISSLSSFYYQLNILAVSFLLVGFILLVSKKFIVKDNPILKITNQLNELNNELISSKKEFQDYLIIDIKLDKSLSTETVSEIFGIIELAKKNIIERNELTNKQDKRADIIKYFEDKLNSLKLYIKKELSQDIETIVNLILFEFANSKDLFGAKIKLQEKLNQKKLNLERTEAELEQVQKAIRALLQSINAIDIQDFQTKYKHNDRIKELIAKKKNACQTIETIVGLGKVNEITDYFSHKEKQVVVTEKNDLDNELKKKAEEFKSKHSELIEKKTEIRRIEGESELALILTELETEKQKLNDKYSSWITGKIALKILEEVKAKYEIEKQPEVIKNSSVYFAKITNEKYKRINASLQEEDVNVFDSNERSKKLDQLSRGTKEQLLISLRLGFIEEYEKTAEPLPLIVDEILVNFDPARAKQTAKILHHFAENRQVLIFTCHPITKDYFENLQVNIIEV